MPQATHVQAPLSRSPSPTRAPCGPARMSHPESRRCRSESPTTSALSGARTPELTIVPKGTQPSNGSWWLVLLNHSDQANALGYHDLATEGLPLVRYSPPAI